MLATLLLFMGGVSAQAADQMFTVRVENVSVGNILKLSNGKTGTRRYRLLHSSSPRAPGIGSSRWRDEEFRNKGVEYCALCDGPLYEQKVVAVVGGSDAAANIHLIDTGLQDRRTAAGPLHQDGPLRKQR